MVFGGAPFSGVSFADVPTNVPSTTVPTWFGTAPVDVVRVPIVVGGWTVAPILPPSVAVPAWFQGRYPDQVRAGVSAASTTFTEPLLPPPVPFVAAYFSATIDRRATTHPAAWVGPILPPPSTATVYFPLVVAPASLTALRLTPSPAWTAPLLPQAQELPPFGWWPDYPTMLPIVTYTADIVGVFAADIVTPPQFRRTLQWRIGSRTEPEKL